jgi:hypothetical protein
MSERTLTFEVMKSAAEAQAEILEAAGVAYLYDFGHIHAVSVAFGGGGQDFWTMLEAWVAQILAEQEAAWKLAEQEAARKLVDQEVARMLAETFTEVEKQVLEEAKTQEEEAAWEEVPTRNKMGKKKEENRAGLLKQSPPSQKSYYAVLLLEKKTGAAIEKGEDDCPALLSSDGTS